MAICELCSKSTEFIRVIQMISGKAYWLCWKCDKLPKEQQEVLLDEKFRRECHKTHTEARERKKS
jgi:hypothetical protein